MSKRANGEGTIVKRSDGRWEGKFCTGRYNKNGTLERKSVYGKTKAEVRKKLSVKTNAVTLGTYIPPNEMTVSQWLDEWQESYLLNVKESTKVRYRRACKNRIKPYLGDVKLQKLTTGMVQKMYDKLMKPKTRTFKNGKTGEVKGLDPSGVQFTHVVLNMALNQAVSNNIISKNPCSSCKLPRSEKKEMIVLYGDLLSAFMKEIKNKPFEKLFEVYLFTGMRESEGLGLKWSDIDLVNKKITINKQLKQQSGKNGQEYVFDSLKNRKSREIYIPDYVVDVLKRVKREQEENKLHYGSSFQNSDNLVFTTELGRHLVHQTVYRALKAYATAIGVPDFRVHDLRHTYATTAIANGDDIKTVSINLGHSSVAYTLDKYGHRTEMMARQSADRMQKFILETVTA